MPKLGRRRKRASYSRKSCKAKKERIEFLRDAISDESQTENRSDPDLDYTSKKPIESIKKLRTQILHFYDKQNTN